ncbi:hypothetical protein BD324DRAFT_607080 [Kockovaella imperatae]|uniref:Uncharacterized protein n=1 Tax=Kockovaella imperatae TaxID=4999 RepID=A0A1Y1UQR1_9TREE|nr:hypothetical protein BD324DRAFT_607080 [Kockovaella imperatae]ORX39907.1 hypothetical protein BD324DRAFT_607080 [Kockovaella imperatae]
MTNGNNAAKRMPSAALGGRQSRRLQMRNQPVPVSVAGERGAGERWGGTTFCCGSANYSDRRCGTRSIDECGREDGREEDSGERLPPESVDFGSNIDNVKRKYKPNGSVVVGMVEHRGSSRCERCQLDDLPCFQREGKATMKCKSCTSDHCSFHSGHAGSPLTRASGSAQIPKASSKALVHLEQSDSEDDIEQLEESDDEDQGSGKKRKRGRIFDTGSQPVSSLVPS